MCLFTRIRIRKRVSCTPAPAFLVPLTGTFGRPRDLLLTEAIVYQQMYSQPLPTAAPAVATAAAQAVEIQVPQATYSGPEVLAK